MHRKACGLEERAMIGTDFAKGWGMNLINAAIALGIAVESRLLDRFLRRRLEKLESVQASYAGPACRATYRS
jgi:hypothetical protein